MNDGAASFTDATAERMPPTLVGFSWDLELVDVDNDWDLDAAVSCKACPSSLLYENDGSGTFSDVTEGRLPAYSNNYEFAPVDLDGDGFLDLVTINDGPQRSAGLAEHVFRNDGAGRFTDVTDEWWPVEANPGWDDNVVVALDADSDGDADFLIGSLDGPDRLLLNDGSGALTLHDDVFNGSPSRGTLGIGRRRPRRRRPARRGREPGRGARTRGRTRLPGDRRGRPGHRPADHPLGARRRLGPRSSARQSDAEHGPTTGNP